VRDKVLLVSGTTGIAAATSNLALDAGARVFVVGLGEAPALPYPDVGFMAGDLRVPGVAEEAVRRCVECFGRVDALFNVAGISGRRQGDGPLHECSDEGWEVTLDTNLTTVFRLSRATLRQMLAQMPKVASTSTTTSTPASGGLRGSILHMASVLALAPEPRHFATHAYAASKAALLGLTRAMAAYYAPYRIRVNAIAPGLVRTPMSERAQSDPEIQRRMESKQPLTGGLIEADAVARVALFLLGDDAAAITGDALLVDAGWSVSP